MAHDELLKKINRQLHNSDIDLKELVDREKNKGEDADIKLRHAAEIVMEDHETFREEAERAEKDSGE